MEEPTIKKEKKKNVVILVVDAFRPKNLSLFGYDKKTDENLFKIANEGFVFKDYFSSSNSTTPALVSIFTGLYPKNHGIMHQLPYTKQEEIDKFFQNNCFWLPEFLREKGYTTIAIDWLGLWFKKGFDYYGDGMSFEDVKKAPFNSAENLAEMAISKVSESKNPFFLFVHFWDTHFPFPHTNYEEKSGTELAIEQIEGENQKEYFRKRMKGNLSFTFEDLVGKYDSSIKRVDKQIGKICDFLKEKNLWDDTIFIVLGDHGTNLTEHKTYFSSSGLYDNSINTFLYMHLPEKGTKRIRGFVQDIDILPTILENLELEIPKNIDGKTIMPLIKKGIPVREHIFSFDGLCEDIVCVRDFKKKLIVAKNNHCYLCKGKHHEEIEEYEIGEDPGEKKDIYSGESELKKFLD